MPKTLIKLKTGTIAKMENSAQKPAFDEGTVYFAIDTYGSGTYESGTKIDVGQIIYDAPDNRRIIMGQRVELTDDIWIEQDNVNEIYISGVETGPATDPYTGNSKGHPLYSGNVSFIDGSLYAEDALNIGPSTVSGVNHGDTFVGKYLSVNSDNFRVGDDVLTAIFPTENTDGSLVSTVDTSITSETGSTSTSTGALAVAGGVGIGENLYVGGISYHEDTVNIVPNIKQIEFRPDGSNTSTFLSHQTAGTEALILGTQSASTSFIVKNSEDPSLIANNRWQSLTEVGLQVKNNCVSIGALIGQGTTPTYRFSVDGTSYFSDYTIHDGGIEIYGQIAGDNTTTGHGLNSGGAYHNAYNNLLLHGDPVTGTSGIAFISDKGGSNINQPGDRAFIQYHAYGIGALSAENVAPTLSTSGEAGRLVIGIGDNATGTTEDQVYIQTPGSDGLKHLYNGTTLYTIPSMTTTETTAYYPVISSTVAGVNQYNTSITMNGDTITATTFVGDLTGNADTATALETAFKINDTFFDGTYDITTDKWGESRTITIGSTGKAVNGSANVSWSHAEIGATVSNTVTNGTTNGPTVSTTVNGVTGTAVTIPLNSRDYAGVIPRGSGNANMAWKTDSNGVPGWRADAAAAPIIENVTLLSSGWDTTNNSYTVMSPNATADSIQICSLPDYLYASSDEMDALGAAKLVDGGQGAGYFTLKALGEVPTIDIDILVLYQYSTDGNISYMTSAASSANAAAASAAQAAAFAKMQVKKISIGPSDLSEDLTNTTYPYKYQLIWNGVSADDWVDGSGVSDMDWAVESGTNQIILHFAKNLTSSTPINIYWAACEVVV